MKWDAKVLQWAKHKVAYLYQSAAKEFPDGTKLRLIPLIGTIVSPASKEKYGLVLSRQEAFTAKIGTGTSWEFSQKFRAGPKTQRLTLS